MKLLVTCCVLLIAVRVSAETITFEAHGQSFDIEFVEIGSPGNAADFDERFPGDEKSLGAVNYVYSISKFEASCEGFNVFQGVVGAACRDSDLPLPTSQAAIINYVNWLNELQGSFRAYDDVQFDQFGNVIPGLVRNPGARFFIPTADEWHKAAYYDPIAEVYYDYATGSNTRPTAVAQGTEPGTAVLPFFQDVAPVELAGGLSPFGTVGQTGNRSEIEENLRWYRWGLNTFGQPEAHLARVSANELTGAVGFRLVSIPPVPEPSANILAMFGALAALRFRRTHRYSLR